MKKYFWGEFQNEKKVRKLFFGKSQKRKKNRKLFLGGKIEKSEFIIFFHFLRKLFWEENII